VLGSLYGLLRATYPVDAPRTWRAFAWPGLLGGLGVGLKFTSAVFVPGLALAAVVVAVMRRGAGALFVYAGAAALGFLVVTGHHMLVLWLDFGNPTFPYLNQIFHSPWWEPIAVRDDRFIPQTLWHFLIFPFTWTVLDDYIVSEPFLRDWRFAIAYVAGIAGLLILAVRYLRALFGAPRLAKTGGDTTAWGYQPTRGLPIVYAFVVPSYVAWVLGFGYYRYAVPLEMLTGVITVGVLIWMFDDRRLRISAAVATLAIAMVTTYYLNWGRGQYGDRYVDVRVPPLPEDAIVLIATWDPVAFFIPYAQPRAQYLGIENNYLEIAQHNLLTEKINRIMRTPGRPKFVLSVDAFNADKLNALLAHYDLKLGDAPCRPIETNLSGHSLSLCAVADG